MRILRQNQHWRKQKIETNSGKKHQRGTNQVEKLPQWESESQSKISASADQKYDYYTVINSSAGKGHRRNLANILLSIYLTYFQLLLCTLLCGRRTQTLENYPGIAANHAALNIWQRGNATGGHWRNFNPACSRYSHNTQPMILILLLNCSARREVNWKLQFNPV